MCGGTYDLLGLSGSNLAISARVESEAPRVGRCKSNVFQNVVWQRVHVV